MIIDKEINIVKLYQEIKEVYPGIESIEVNGKDYTFTGLNGDEDLASIIDNHDHVFLPVPEEVRADQLRISLALNGITNEVIYSILESLEEPNKTVAKVKWEYTSTFHRENELLKGVQQALNLTDEQVDNIFINALNF